MPESRLGWGTSPPSRDFNRSGHNYDRRGKVHRTANALGFFGSTQPCRITEGELFDRKDAQSVGINFDKYNDIPVDVKNATVVPCEEFTKEVVGERILKNIDLANYKRPTPVQKYSIPIGSDGNDMMACAQTGSGKTAGFLLPVISAMCRRGVRSVENKNHRCSYPTSVILAPTRELASQIFEEAQKFCYCTGVRPVVVYGGTQVRYQLHDIEQGVDLLVATPGRLIDLIDRGKVSMMGVSFLVLDEADRMLDMGFEPQIRSIIQENNMPVDRQTFMFSATFPSEIRQMAEDFMDEYVYVTVGRVGAASRDVHQTIEWVNEHEKQGRLLSILSEVDTSGLLLVFVETKRGADILERVLNDHGVAAGCIHGDKQQWEREDTLKMFRSGKVRILVATDVASRGLDIPNVTMVVNYDFPGAIDDYVHRIGRTGRVGNIGKAISFLCDKNKSISKQLVTLLRENDQPIPGWMNDLMSLGSKSSGKKKGGGRGQKHQSRGYGGSYSGGYSGGYGGNRGHSSDRDNSAW